MSLSLTVLSGLFKLGDKYIEDKDKKAELFTTAMTTMLNTTTYKWVDALVKLSYAGEQITKGLLRPLGSFALAGFAMYCQVNSIELDIALQTFLYGAPAAWGTSRHIEKSNKNLKQPVEYIDWDDDSD